MANFLKFDDRGQPVSLDSVKRMITDYINRLKSSRTVLTNEAIAVELDRPSLENYLDTHDAVKLVAFFAIDSANLGSPHSTIILTGLDSDGDFIKDAQGDIIATERWDLFKPSVAPTSDFVDKDPTSLTRLLV